MSFPATLYLWPKEELFALMLPRVDAVCGLSRGRCWQLWLQLLLRVTWLCTWALGADLLCALGWEGIRLTAAGQHPQLQAQWCGRAIAKL